MELGRSGRPMMLMMSASPGGGGGAGRAGDGARAIDPFAATGSTRFATGAIDRRRPSSATYGVFAGDTLIAAAWQGLSRHRVARPGGG
jgi:hypothetical protein